MNFMPKRKRGTSQSCIWEEGLSATSKTNQSKRTGGNKEPRKRTIGAGMGRQDADRGNRSLKISCNKAGGVKNRDLIKKTKKVRNLPLKKQQGNLNSPS